ncbi:hypothetical protein DEB41_11480 [Vibrio anguillarum]|uniref:Uncharacterized protein n=1 Tax=Vibrio anguillarum TaxID=55601 RepID=A0AAW4AAT2_VIBAN|nr:hypothetical protein N175_12480 [Vibrio anguillarum M3]ASF91062.1 hypothetical protein CEA93_03125 [Vibrio anguillarum]NNN49099.1 hypothetical protein [Vibrio sp. 2-2(8)]ATA50263.1 hypothetical protein CLI14_11130 [Vibrio anguillarum]AVT68870.1 hypothetical protein B5S57_17325 [Vibrio anguillarum]
MIPKCNILVSNDVIVHQCNSQISFHLKLESRRKIERCKSEKISPTTEGRSEDRQYRKRLFFSLHTRGMVGIVHKNLRKYCSISSAQIVPKPLAKYTLIFASNAFQFHTYPTIPFRLKILICQDQAQQKSALRRFDE